MTRSLRGALAAALCAPALLLPASALAAPPIRAPAPAPPEARAATVAAADSGHIASDPRDKPAGEATPRAPDVQAAPAAIADGGPLSGARCGRAPAQPNPAATPDLSGAAPGTGAEARFAETSPLRRRRC